MPEFGQLYQHPEIKNNGSSVPLIPSVYSKGLSMLALDTTIRVTKRPWKLLFVCLFVTILSKQWLMFQRRLHIQKVKSVTYQGLLTSILLAFLLLICYFRIYLLPFFFKLKNILEVISRQASDQDSWVSLLRAWVQPLVGELKSHKPRSMAKNIYIFILEQEMLPQY